MPGNPATVGDTSGLWRVEVMLDNDAKDYDLENVTYDVAAKRADQLNKQFNQA
jgi:hypothetical protein